MPMPMRRPEAMSTVTVSLDLTGVRVPLVGGDRAAVASLLAAGAALRVVDPAPDVMAGHRRSFVPEDLDGMRLWVVALDGAAGDALAAAARLRMPPTHRGVSRSLHLITAHGRGDEGLPAATPAVAVENATLPDERRIRRALADIAAAVAEAAVEGPTLTLIGDVVALAEVAPHVIRHAA
jgi:putative NAD(P)-binding protein